MHNVHCLWFVGHASSLDAKNLRDVSSGRLHGNFEHAIKPFRPMMPSIGAPPLTIQSRTALSQAWSLPLTQDAYRLKSSELFDEQRQNTMPGVSASCNQKAFFPPPYMSSSQDGFSYNTR